MRRTELIGTRRLQVTECISHSPVYLPKRACKWQPQASCFFVPRSALRPGAFLCAGGAQESLKRLSRLVFALPIERGKLLHTRPAIEFLLHVEERRGGLPSF